MAAIQQERRSIDDLNPAEYNPRKRLQPGDEEYERLKTSIETFGYVDPIIINADGTVIGGHQRLFVLRDLGYSEADVAVVDLSKADEKALNIALNKISGEWDEEKLAEIFAELDAEGYDLSLTGFGEDEYAGIVSALTDSLQTETLCDPDEVQEPPKESVTLLGDVWQIGRHRLVCGDSTDKATVDLLMDGHKADMVFTDPPYGMDLDTDYSKMPGTTTRYSRVIGDDKEFDMTKIFANIKSPVWYVWGADYLYKSIPNFGDGVYIVWSKRMSDEENKVFGSAYELCWTYPKRKKEIWFVRGINQSCEHLGVHPTQKPTELCKRALTQNEKAIAVVDLFGGSGSTLIACDQLDRTCYMMELDPKYCDVIVRRYMQVTGKRDVVLLRDGKEIPVEETEILN